MADPFETDGGSFFVLTNEEELPSLWPAAADVPQGWAVEFGPASRRACAAYLHGEWPIVGIEDIPAAPVVRKT